MTLRATTSQTVGPFFSIGMERLNCAELAGPGIAGERVTIEGRVLDADGVGVPDAVIEIASGLYIGGQQAFAVFDSIDNARSSIRASHRVAFVWAGTLWP